MQDNQLNQQPEIDLLHFLKPVSRLAAKIRDSVKNYFLTLSLNGILFFFIIALCGAAGAVYCYFTKPAFKTEAIFISHLLPAGVCVDMLNNLNNPHLSRASELKLSNSAVESLKSIDAKKLPVSKANRTYDSLLYYNNDTLLSTFQITLILRNYDYIDTIQKALLDYLEYSPFSKSRTAARKQALLSLRGDLEAKLRSMDSVQLLVNNTLQFKKEYANGDAVNPMDGYEARIYYSKEKIAIDQELNIIDNIELMQPFIKYSSYNYPEYLTLLLLAITSGLILALILTPLLGKKLKTK